MMRTTTRALLLAAAAVLMSGCATRVINDPAVPIEVSGPVAIDIETFNGDVFIRADPTAAPSVRLVRESVHGPKRKKEAEASLDQIGCDVELQGGELGQVVRVRTTTDHAEPHFQRAHVHVTLPQISGVTVRTNTGRIEAFNIEGRIEISSGDGDVLVATVQPLRDPVRITTGNGDVDLRCRGESQGELDFHADGGTALCKVRRGQTIIHPGTDHDTVLASFNEGPNPIVLRTLGGDIRFVVVPDPMSYASLIVE